MTYVVNPMNPAKFIREVRLEAGRVTWPSRKETTVSTTLVLVLVLISALFFLAVDWGIAQVVGKILGFGQ